MPTRQRSQEQLLGITFLLMTLLGWSAAPLFLEYFTGLIDAWTANGWRYGMAAMFWLPVLIVTVRRGGVAPGIWRAAIWPTIFNTVGQAAYAWVLYLDVEPGLMSFLLRSQIVFVTAGAFLLFPDERRLIRRGGFWIGLLLVLGGTMGTIFLGQSLPAGAGVLGVTLGLLSGALFGGYGLTVRYYMQRYSPTLSFAVISLYSAAAMIATMLALGRDHGADPMRMTAGQFGLLFLSAMVGIAAAHVFYYASINRLGVAAASGVLLMHPFLTGVMSWLLFSEQMTAGQWIAGTVCVIGAAAILHTQNRLHRQPAAFAVISEKDDASEIAPAVAAPTHPARTQSSATA